MPSVGGRRSGLGVVTHADYPSPANLVAAVEENDPIARMDRSCSGAEPHWSRFASQLVSSARTASVSFFTYPEMRTAQKRGLRSADDWDGSVAFSCLAREPSTFAITPLASGLVLGRTSFL